ncbi:MAG: serine--tRNA ligase [Acidobacteria bacterium]|nr:serine--tRNA ligase [Acidobacteriota bacterium]MYG74082.1 serine--tRNA ligase [Acidobacteriota bacterium]
MLDPDRIRRDPEGTAERLRDRGHSGDLSAILSLFEERRRLQASISDLRAALKARNREVGALYRAGKKEAADQLREDLARAPDEVSDKEERMRAAEQELEASLLELPNLAHESVPVGLGEEANQEIRRTGTPRSFDFEPRPHHELGAALGMLDLPRAAKLSGSRFAVLAGAGARLERALIQFMLDVQTKERGYKEVWLPFLVNSRSLVGTGQLPKFADDLFKAEGRDLYLIPTAEVPLTNLHAGETLAAEDLPKRYASYTPCFRAEAGAHGKDTQGLIRQHQFDKVELVKVTDDESSFDELEGLTRDAEHILDLLGIPYRVVLLSTGDTGGAATKTYDIEVWLPAQGTYREISSCSNCGDYQARRAGIRYRRAPGEKTRFCHTLNGSGLAVGRTWLAILENYQQPDGSVTVPEVLRPYLDGLESWRPT